MKTQRSHDEFYLHEDRYEKVKESFKFIFENTFNPEELINPNEICDLGCATGEFIHFLKTKTTNSTFYGLDIMKSLLRRAMENLPNENFKCGSVLDKNLYNKNSFDKIFLNGVLTIFDNFEPVFNNMINWTKKGGYVYVFGMFNPYPIDVLVKHKLSENYSANIYEEGWNNHSIESVSNFLSNNRDVSEFNFKKFEIQIDLKESNDIRRGWTFKNSDNKRVITNGLCIIQNQYLLSIRV